MPQQFMESHLDLERGAFPLDVDILRTEGMGLVLERRMHAARWRWTDRGQGQAGREGDRPFHLK